MEFIVLYLQLEDLLLPEEHVLGGVVLGSRERAVLPFLLSFLRSLILLLISNFEIKLKISIIQSIDHFAPSNTPIENSDL